MVILDSNQVYRKLEEKKARIVFFKVLYDEPI